MKYLFWFLFFTSVIAYAQISPGDLTKAHAGLEGISSCTKCHEIGEKVKNSNCLACHTEVAELIKQNRGYHSGSEVKGKSCAACHSEHHGRNFRIINFKKENFDHSKTGFVLTGKHSSLECSQCHNSRYIVNESARKMKTEWIGLNTFCSSCHTDYHKGTLGNNCGNCHNNEKFRPSMFNHDNAKFTLTGSHQKVLCMKCHPVEKKNGTEFQKFKGIEFSSCESCHKDVHSGRLGKECRSCHNTNSFRTVNQGAFDHNKTSFPLHGKHIPVSCIACHKNGFKEKLKFEKCNDCHKDYHNGEFTLTGVTTDCKNCHNVDSFSPSLFSIDDHKNTKFPLTGSHLAVPCNSCHYKENKWTFRLTGTECSDCHKNVHGNEITEKYLADSGCRNCHSINSWRNINFDHNKTEFLLLGKHARQDCRSCHILKQTGLHRFASLKSDCTGCHDDIHAGQFGTGLKEECGRCHTFDNWKPEKFDHNKTRFSLEGAHSRLKCSECHKTSTLNDKSFIKYRLEDFKCASCHS